jgi:hypothetical protein
MKNIALIVFILLGFSMVSFGQNNSLDSLKLKDKSYLLPLNRAFEPRFSATLPKSGSPTVLGNGGGGDRTLSNLCPGMGYIPGNMEYRLSDGSREFSIVRQLECNLAFGFPDVQFAASGRQGWDHFQFREFQTMHCDGGGTHFAFNSFSEFDGGNWKYPRITDKVEEYLAYREAFGSSDFVLAQDGSMAWRNAGPGDKKGPIHPGIYLDPYQNFGVGLENPSSKLHVNGDVRIGAMSGGAGTLYFMGGSDFGAGSENGDPIHISRVNGRLDQSTLRVCVGDDGSAAENQQDKVEFGYYTYNPQPNTDPWRAAVAIYANGNLFARKVKVTLDNFPDYVFAPNYKLPSLKETESFIQQNGHLPEVPCAAEVEQNGADLGELNKILLKKIEEMTLHLIRLEKEVEALKKTN